MADTCLPGHGPRPPFQQNPRDHFISRRRGVPPAPVLHGRDEEQHGTRPQALGIPGEVVQQLQQHPERQGEDPSTGKALHHRPFRAGSPAQHTHHQPDRCRVEKHRDASHHGACRIPANRILAA